MLVAPEYFAQWAVIYSFINASPGDNPFPLLDAALQGLQRLLVHESSLRSSRAVKNACPEMVLVPIPLSRYLNSPCIRSSFITLLSASMRRARSRSRRRAKSTVSNPASSKASVIGLSLITGSQAVCVYPYGVADKATSRLKAWSNHHGERGPLICRRPRTVDAPLFLCKYGCEYVDVQGVFACHASCRIPVAPFPFSFLRRHSVSGSARIVLCCSFERRRHVSFVLRASLD